jgi:alpha-L-rhamnosidase
VPTDCPQRDERLGWTGDAQVFAPTASFNMDVAGFFTKWMLDLDDAQTPDGDIPEVAPALFVTRDAGPGWSDARVVIPLAMYHAYGDKQLLERHYPSMRRWIQHHIRTSQNGTRCFPDTHTWQGFGDWLALDGNSLNPLKNATPRELIATAYFAYALDVIRQIADILGHTADARLFAETRRQAADAFCHHFFTPTGRSTAPSQTSYLMALAFDLLPEDLRPRALAHLVELIHERDDHLSTGFLGTLLLCPVLTRFGRVDLAYKLLLQTTYPSWLYPITLGATTMWERWNSWHPDKGFVDTTMNSLNHYAYGAVGEWMYATIAGLQPLAPGYQHVLIAPKPGGGLRHAAATLDTLHGRISVSWQVDDTGFHLTTALPANTTAQATLPDGTQRQLAAGQHKLSCPFCLA